MATITVRNVSEAVLDRIKKLAKQKGVSMGQEVRDLLQARYGNRDEVLKRIRQRADILPIEQESQVQDWKETGRP
jgi:plasmid stability protein